MDMDGGNDGNGNAMTQPRSAASITIAMVRMDLRGTHVADGIGSHRKSFHVARMVRKPAKEWVASSSNLSFMQKPVPSTAFVGDHRTVRIVKILLECP